MLSDLEIKKLLRFKTLIKPYNKERLGPVSYDIETDLQDWHGNIARLVSKETYTLPRSIAGIISLRSRGVVKEGVFTSYSTLVDPGYSGKLTFLVYVPIGYAFDWRNLFQIMFIAVDGEVEVDYSQRKSSTAMHRDGF